MILPDPAKSRAVLIGVSEYTTLPPLPTVSKNVSALKSILTGSTSWALPSSNCIAVENPRTPEELVDPVFQCAEEATDTLLVYYAGHGLRGQNRGELRLTRTTSRAGAPHTSTDFNDIREALLGSIANRRIVILDCCYAASALGIMADPAHVIAEDALVEGTYLIAAAGETQTAIAQDGNGFTVFTGELVNVLQKGIPDGAKKYLDLDTVFNQLFHSLRSKARPLPHRRVRNSPGAITLALNAQWSGREPAKGAESQSFAPAKPTVAVSSAPGAWPTSAKSQSQPAAQTHGATTPNRPGAWPTPDTAPTTGDPNRTDTSERRPGAWPTSAKSQPQPAAQTHGATTPNRPGAWPTPDTAPTTGDPNT
ncbi:caspase family protein, partial [Streptomyces iakyrus]|uniref:caspase family protein n=1 Tax=Streptomyces iakyrus TaxID=68219 RepID=UPI003806C23C